MIKINKSTIVLISLSLFLFVGYNVLTAVEAVESNPMKKYCDGKGEWNGKTCVTYNEEEKAAWEDAVCDNEDADSTDVKMCMSDKREQQMKNIEKTCDKVDGKMTKDGFCDTDGSGDTPKADRFNDELMKLEEEQKQEEEIAKTVKDSEPWTNDPTQQVPVETNEDWKNTVTTTDAEEANQNNIDSDKDGIYDDEELSEEEEKELAKSKGADEMTDKEKKKLDEENQKVVDEWVKDELKATEDELRAMTASKPNYDK